MVSSWIAVLVCSKNKLLIWNVDDLVITLWQNYNGMCFKRKCYSCSCIDNWHMVIQLVGKYIVLTVNSSYVHFRFGFGWFFIFLALSILFIEEKHQRTKIAGCFNKKMKQDIQFVWNYCGMKKGTGTYLIKYMKQNELSIQEGRHLFWHVNP